MRRLVSSLLLVSWVGFGCGTPGPTEPGPPPALAACTLATPLTPGVPGSPGHLLPSDINPNGASELAVLMRAMQSDLRASREALLGGPPAPAMLARHARIRCAWPTDLADRDEAIEAFAIHYLTAVERREAADADPRVAHERVIDACLACHAEKCQGPMQAIESLRLPAR